MGLLTGLGSRGYPALSRPGLDRSRREMREDPGRIARRWGERGHTRVMGGPEQSGTTDTSPNCTTPNPKELTTPRVQRCPPSPPAHLHKVAKKPASTEPPGHAETGSVASAPQVFASKTNPPPVRIPDHPKQPIATRSAKGLSRAICEPIHCQVGAFGPGC